MAQQLLDNSVTMGAKRVATSNGVAFVAQETGADVWHGYPEAWDMIDHAVKKEWIKQGFVQRAALRCFATREQLRDEFGGSLS